MKKIFIIPMIIVLLVAFSLAGCADGKEAPEAAFSASPTSGEMPLTVQFTDQSTGEVDDWAWDFGDDSTSTAQSPSHTYDTAGNYTVSLEVTGPDGSDTETKTNHIAVTTPVPPEVVSTVPAADATVVEVTTTVSATFSEDMDSTTINATSFLLTTDSVAVNGTVSYDAGTKTATFIPSADLGFETTYTANITTAVTDLTTDPMTEDYVWSFTTAPPFSTWIYNITYVRTTPDPYTENSTRKVTLVEFDVTPTHLANSTVAIPEVTCNHLFLDYRFGNTTPSRWNPGSPFTVNQYSKDSFVSTANGTQVYEYVTGLAVGAPLEVELVYHNYTLLSGSNIGLPYAVNSSWSYNVTTEPSVGGQSFGATTENFTATVTAENQEVTVPAGTFDDCVQIELRDAGGGLLKTMWWSPTVQELVKLEDVGSYVGLTADQQPLDGTETWELTDYTLI